MFLRLTVMLLGIAMGSCADLDDGTGGTGGVGGDDGTGGAIAGEAPKLEPLLGSREPAFDWAMPGLAIGQVSGACPSPVSDPSECEGPDPADEWTAISSRDGEHCFDLVWSPGVCAPQSTLCSDLDLVLRDPSGALLDQSADDAPDRETICAGLTADAKYFITVLAFETNGKFQNYTLAVARSE